MTESTSSAGPIRVTVIVGRDQMGWSSVGRLRAGLTGMLAEAELFVAPSDERTLLATIEGAVFSRRAALNPVAEWKSLPDDPSKVSRCDVIIDFRSAPVADDLAARAGFGAWQCSCHDSSTVAASALRGDSAVQCHLLRRTADSPALRQLASAVIQTKVTMTHSQAFASEKMVQVTLRELRRLALTGDVADEGIYANGTAVPALGGLPGYAGRILRKVALKVAPRGLQPKTQPFALRVGQGDLPGIDPSSGTDIPLPPETFCADPFLIERGGEVYCFYEEFPYSTRRGHITVARLTASGAHVLGPALVADHHLSFPYLFESDGDLFMMPETIQAARLEVWRCVDFPLKWELHATGLEGELLGDPVLFQQGEDWWLAANSCQDSFGDFSSELCLYRTDGPDLNWITPHPLNPVVVGSDVARNAGRVFQRDGRLYRLSQDNSGDVYGYGLNLMEITTLSKTAYTERRVLHFTPDQIPGAIGCHHADAAGGLFVVDVRWPKPPQAV